MRIARLHAPGVLHHLIWRFVDREWFFEGDIERDRYMRLLGRALEESDWRCVAFVLMSNHIHIGAVSGHEPLAQWSRRVNSPFAHWMNERRGRLGPIFADRPQSFAVRPEGEGAVIAYIHNNPVRAGVVSRAADSVWTSHPAYLGAHRPPWLHVSEGLLRAGFANAPDFDAWVDSAPSDASSLALAEIRRVVRRRGSIELATPIANDQVRLVARPFGHIRPEPRRLVQIVCEVTGVEEFALCSRRRNPTLHAARVIAIRSGRSLGLTGNDLAAALGVSAQTVSRLARDSAHKTTSDLVQARLELEYRAM